MFTGIIEELGVIKAIARQPAGARIEIMAKQLLDDLSVGESVAVSGACLTVTGLASSSFEADLSGETLQRTTLGQMAVGDAVNLERSLRFNGRVGGHLVSGHVDGVGRIAERRQEGDMLLVLIELPAELRRYCVSKGSIAVDGVSLTINDVTRNTLSVTVIPHTAKMTTLGLKGAGGAVNLETDLIGKYIEQLLGADRGRPGLI